jgi:hypothetical protein
MTKSTLTFKAQSFYVAYAPEVGIWSDGDCFEEAANRLTDKLRAVEPEAKQVTGDERNME